MGATARCSTSPNGCAEEDEAGRQGEVVEGPAPPELFFLDFKRMLCMASYMMSPTKKISYVGQYPSK